MAQLLPEAAASSDGAAHIAFQEQAAFREEDMPSAGEGDSANRLPCHWICRAALWPWPDSKACWAMLYINTHVDVYR